MVDGDLDQVKSTVPRELAGTSHLCREGRGEAQHPPITRRTGSHRFLCTAPPPSSTLLSTQPSHQPGSQPKKSPKIDKRRRSFLDDVAAAKNSADLLNPLYEKIKYLRESFQDTNSIYFGLCC
ncbi:hypothetical protein LSTR_LSTR000135 [Laodelphax striatellus]|uniref:Uncharacterized protein n=1 Tax=Laodelphax striatellus TaxID=195883 RepID=A0A482X7Y6_LAOST|nr:hypothetical protein LSTR_LSTR000135 [Laodelphax striatellus]